MIRKSATIKLFLISLGAIIVVLKVVGSWEEQIEALSSSLEEKEGQLIKVTREKDALEKENECQKVAFQEELKQEKKLRNELRESLNRIAASLKKDLEKERKERATLEEEFKKLKTAKNFYEKEYKGIEQKWLALRKMVEEAAPEVKGQIEVPGEAISALPSREIGGKLSYVYSPFLSIELEKGAAGDVKPTILVYRGEKLIKEVKAKQIHYMTMVARVAEATSLKGIKENDQVKLNLLPGVSHLLESEKLSGKIWAVQSPSFLTVALGKEAGSTISPFLSVYRDGRLVKEMKLSRIEPVTIVVEVADKMTIKGIRENDRVEVIERGGENG
ncbi:hypothetical protein KAU86_03000 [bacterium]|nr:hypothetical protein [bacterium]MCK4326427.1 hypothetical protein [bacterium]MCK4436896.1 hypothetical protein [bacterium]